MQPTAHGRPALVLRWPFRCWTFLKMKGREGLNLRGRRDRQLRPWGLRSRPGLLCGGEITARLRGDNSSGIWRSPSDEIAVLKGQPSANLSD